MKVIYLNMVNYCYLIIYLNVRNGLIRGRRILNKNGNRGYVYLGIPYAETPSNILRFSVPTDKDNWEGELDATQYKDGCPWNTSTTDNKHDAYNTSENCLTVNVFTSASCLIYGNCPVVFFGLGGGFRFNSPVILDQTILIDNFANNDRNIIFVSFSHRLGMLGLLNLNNKLNLSTQPNILLFDTLKALKWVHKEIVQFGGDAARITLMGHSAGSCIMTYLSVSPKAYGLYDKVILMSAARLPFEFGNNNQNVSRQLAIHAECAFQSTDWDKVEDVENVLDCLRKKDVSELMSIQKLLEDSGVFFESISQDSGKNSFFERPIDVLEKVKPNVAMLLGTTKEEIGRGKNLLLKNNTTIVDVEKLKAVCNAFITAFDFEYVEAATNECVLQYKDDPYATIHIEDDLIFNLPILHQATLNSGRGLPTFLYQFEFSGSLNKSSQPSNFPYHGFELRYLVGLHSENMSIIEKIVQRQFSKMFISFIAKGNPGCEDIRFKQFDNKINNYFVVDFNYKLEISGMTNNYHEKASNFWNRILPDKVGSYNHESDEGDYLKVQKKCSSAMNNASYIELSYPESFYKGIDPPKPSNSYQTKSSILISCLLLISSIMVAFDFVLSIVQHALLYAGQKMRLHCTGMKYQKMGKCVIHLGGYAHDLYYKIRMYRLRLNKGSGEKLRMDPIAEREGTGITFTTSTPYRYSTGRQVTALKSGFKDDITSITLTPIAKRRHRAAT
uniref:COesterase domain-containing protein n=1 Tax=Rhabditophanes sp. KR3021 TaxID=114890 RepID=A0AC35TJE7_9BILA